MITANVLRFVVTSIATIFRTSDCIDSRRFFVVQSNFYRCFRQIAGIHLLAFEQRLIKSGWTKCSTIPFRSNDGPKQFETTIDRVISEHAVNKVFISARWPVNGGKRSRNSWRIRAKYRTDIFHVPVFPRPPFFFLPRTVPFVSSPSFCVDRAESRTLAPLSSAKTSAVRCVSRFLRDWSIATGAKIRWIFALVIRFQWMSNARNSFAIPLVRDLRVDK